MELEQAGFHSDEPWLSIESAIKGLHQIEMAHAIQTEVHSESNSANNQTNTTAVEDRKPINALMMYKERTVALMLKVENIPLWLCAIRRHFPGCDFHHRRQRIYASRWSQWLW